MLGGNNTYSGGTEVQGGTLSVSSNANLGGGGLTLDQNTMVNVTGITTFTHDIALNGDPTIEVDSGSTTVTSTISGNGADLVKTGSGTLALNPTSGFDTYSGGTMIYGRHAGTRRSSGRRRPRARISFNGAVTLASMLVRGRRVARSTIRIGINFVRTGDMIDFAGLGYNTAERRDRHFGFKRLS